MNNDHSQKKVITKILNSKEFLGCKIEKKLLEYLHEATLAGKGTKEIAIAMEVFAKSASFNTAEDPIVRVHIHKLRKKLQTYYLTEGKDDKLRVEIPKGSYEIKFETIKPTTALKLPAISKILPIANALLLVILVSTLLYRWQCSNNQTGASHGIEAVDRSSPIWGDLLTNRAPTQIVLGDQFFFLEGPPSYPYRISRITSINSAADLSKYLSTRKDTSTAIIPYKPELFEKEILWSLAYLLPKFQRSKTPFELTASSELKWPDVEKTMSSLSAPTKPWEFWNRS